MVMKYSSACEGEKNHAFGQLVSINIVGESGGKGVFGSPLFISLEHNLYPFLVDWICFYSAGVLGQEGVSIREHAVIIK